MKVIVHNSISLDGSLLGFAVDMAAHYQIAGRFKADIHLVGSNTAAAGLKLFYAKLPREEPADFARPKADRTLPLWVIPDSRGKLKGKLHVLRRSGYCRDIVILTSKATPKGYLRYLTARDYDWHDMGSPPRDYARAFDRLAKEYRARTVLSDSGRTLNGILLDRGLVDEISLLVHPVIAGRGRFPLFAGTKNDRQLKLLEARPLAGKLWVHFRVLAGR